MLGKTPNKVYDPFLKAGLGYQNPERLKKAIAAQPKMYHVEMLQKHKNEIDKNSRDQTNIQVNLLKRIKILENDFKRSQAQSIDFELKLQHQKEKMACDVSWKSRLSTLNDENMLLKTQVDVVVQEKGNIKLEYQKLFNSIKATRDQHQQEVNELIESINQNTYAYGDVRSENQDLLMKFFELKDKLKTFEKGKGVNTKFDKSVTLEKLLCVTPLPNNTAVKAKKVSNTKVKTRVKRSNSVRRPKSKDNKSKNRVSKSINDKSSSAHLEKVSSSVSIDSNKRETMNSTADPHDHIREFLAICNMFRYGETQREVVKLLIFPLSFCDKAKAWFNELNEESITS
ncbi:hypothetical protein Tco_1569212 [Tanacetum coccineum]